MPRWAHLLSLHPRSIEESARPGPSLRLSAKTPSRQGQLLRLRTLFGDLPTEATGRRFIATSSTPASKLLHSGARRLTIHRNKMSRPSKSIRPCQLIESTSGISAGRPSRSRSSSRSSLPGPFIQSRFWPLSSSWSLPRARAPAASMCPGWPTTSHAMSSLHVQLVRRKAASPVARQRFLVGLGWCGLRQSGLRPSMATSEAWADCRRSPIRKADKLAVDIELAPGGAGQAGVGVGRERRFLGQLRHGRLHSGAACEFVFERTVRTCRIEVGWSGGLRRPATRMPAARKPVRALTGCSVGLSNQTSSRSVRPRASGAQCPYGQRYK